MRIHFLGAAGDVDWVGLNFKLNFPWRVERPPDDSEELTLNSENLVGKGGGN